MTSVELSFNSAGSTVAIAWGGHIASQSNWGRGNSAIFINGSPYHMSLDLLDGASTGAQDRALAVITSAIFYTPSITTTVINDSTGLPIVPLVIAGTSVHDNASLSLAAINAGGNLTYNFYTNGLCSGTPSTTQTVTVRNAVVPPSSSTGPLAAGTYSYNATYSGDPIDFSQLPNGACEPFSVIADFAIHNSGSMLVSPGFSSGNTIWLDYPDYPFIPNYAITPSCTAGLPNGASCGFNPSTGNPPYSSSLIITTTPTTHLGSYMITVTGTGGGLTRTTQFTLTVVSGSVGGTVLPTAKPSLLISLLPYAALLFVSTAVALAYYRRKRRARNRVAFLL